jgi:hypothetical protein
LYLVAAEGVINLTSGLLAFDLKKSIRSQRRLCAGRALPNVELVVVAGVACERHDPSTLAFFIEK